MSPPKPPKRTESDALSSATDGAAPAALAAAADLPSGGVRTYDGGARMADRLFQEHEGVPARAVFVAERQGLDVDEIGHGSRDGRARDPRRAVRNERVEVQPTRGLLGAAADLLRAHDDVAETARPVAEGEADQAEHPHQQMKVARRHAAVWQQHALEERASLLG